MYVATRISRRWARIIGLLGNLLLVATAVAYELDWYTFDGGGIMWSTGGAYQLSGTIGQPDTGVMAGGSYTISGGFWAPTGDRCSPCLGDLTSDGFRNVTDFTLFAGAYGSRQGDPDYNPCADLNGNGFINVSDFTLFAAVFGVPCP
jgi:hypothetical protein